MNFLKWGNKDKTGQPAQTETVLVETRPSINKRRSLAIVVALVAGGFLFMNYAKRYGWLPGTKPEAPRYSREAAQTAITPAVPLSENGLQETPVEKPGANQVSDESAEMKPAVALEAQPQEPTPIVLGDAKTPTSAPPRAADTASAVRVDPATSAPSATPAAAPAVKEVQPDAAPKIKAVRTATNPVRLTDDADLKPQEPARTKAKPVTHRPRPQEPDTWGDGTRIF